MARPQKQTIDYFPHYVSDGKTKLILQNEFGNDGYAFWYKLLELLCKSENQVYDYNNPASWRLLLAETSVAEDIANRLLQLLADLGTIDPELHENKIIWSQNLIENLELVYKRRATGTPERPVIANKKPFNANKNRHTIQYNTILNNIYTVPFNLWNELKIISHKKLTPFMKSSIDKVLKDYTLEEVKQSMNNYSEVLKNPKCELMSYSWTLAEFLTRGGGDNIEKFSNLEKATLNYSRNKPNGDGVPRKVGDKWNVR